MGDGRADAVVIGDIERHHMGRAAFGLDLGAQLLQAFNATRGQHHLGAVGRENTREAGTQAAGGAGDECDFSGEIECGGHVADDGFRRDIADACATVRP